MRQSISEKRRKFAEKHAQSVILKKISSKERVLSFASFSDEISTKAINTHLASQQQLLLPKITQNTLKIYAVNNLQLECQINPQGILEPIIGTCQKIDPKSITFALIPGLAFDTNNHRLGYGKGFYDRFFPLLEPQAQMYGFGFLEQLSKTPLPTEKHDVSLSGLLLF